MLKMIVDYKKTYMAYKETMPEALETERSLLQSERRRLASELEELQRRNTALIKAMHPRKSLSRILWEYVRDNPNSSQEDAEDYFGLDLKNTVNNSVYNKYIIDKQSMVIGPEEPCEFANQAVNFKKDNIKSLGVTEGVFAALSLGQDYQFKDIEAYLIEHLPTVYRRQSLGAILGQLVNKGKLLRSGVKGNYVYNIHPKYKAQYNEHA